MEKSHESLVSKFRAWVAENGRPQPGTREHAIATRVAHALTNGRLAMAHLGLQMLHEVGRVPVRPGTIAGSRSLPSTVAETGPVKRVAASAPPQPVAPPEPPVVHPIPKATQAFHDALSPPQEPPVVHPIPTVYPVSYARRIIRRGPMKLARRDEQRHPPGATRLFSKFIHPAFRGTSVAFHTLRLLAHAKEKQGGWTGALKSFARAILGGKRQSRDPYTGDQVNPFGQAGAYLKSLKASSGIPEHLHDLADRYNWHTADRRHSLDAAVYDLIRDTHGEGEAADAAIRTIRGRLLMAPEDKKRDVTAKVRGALAKRGVGELPADWHTELLNSVERLHQYAMDRQMLQEEAQERRRVKLTGQRTPRSGQVGWRDWFLGSAASGKRGDPLRLNREQIPHLIAAAHAGRTAGDWLPAAVLADKLEDEGMAYDGDTLHHLRESGPHSIHVHPQTGKVWARVTPPVPQVPGLWGNVHDTDVLRHVAYGPGGHFLVTASRALPDNPIHFVRRVGEPHRYEHNGRLSGWHHIDHEGSSVVPSVAHPGRTTTLGRTLPATVAAADAAAARFPDEEPVRLGRFGQFLGGLAGMVAPLAAGAYLASPSNPLAPVAGLGGIPGAAVGLTVGRHFGAAIGHHTEEALRDLGRRLLGAFRSGGKKRLASDRYLSKLSGGDTSLDPATVEVTNREADRGKAAPDVADRWLEGNSARDSLRAALLHAGHPEADASRLASAHADAWRLNGVHDMIASSAKQGQHGTAAAIAKAGLARLGLFPEAREVPDEAAKPKQQLDLFGDPVTAEPKKKKRPASPRPRGGGKVSKGTKSFLPED